MTNTNIEMIKKNLSSELQVYQNILSEIHNESPDSSFLLYHPAAGETGKLPQEMSDSRFLIQFIEKFGTLIESNIDFTYAIVVASPESHEAKELLKDPNINLLHKAGKLEEIFTTFNHLINFIPGLNGYAPRDEIDEPQYLDYHEKVLNFSSSIAGKLLAVSIVNAACLKVFRDFNVSIQEPLFINALCDLAIYYSKADIKEGLLSNIAQTEDDSLSALARQTLDPLSPKDLKAIATKRDTARRRPKDLTEILSTNDILLTKWLPMALWQKSTKEILNVASELGGNSLGTGSISAGKKIDTAIGRLGLTRFQKSATS